MEVTRRSDALKSALLDSVSHDLRTPLASIRAAAGTLMDPEIDWPAERAPGDRGLDRPRGRLAEPARHEPARHEPDRGRRTATEPRRLRPGRPRRAGASRGPWSRSRWRPAPSRSTCPWTCRRSRSTSCSSARSWPTRWTTPPSTPGPSAPIAVSARRPGRRPSCGSPSRMAVTASRPRRSRGCSRSSIACLARAKGRGAGRASGCRSCRAWSRRWAGVWQRARAIWAGSPWTSTCVPRRDRADLVTGRRSRRARRCLDPAGRGRRSHTPIHRQRSCADTATTCVTSATRHRRSPRGRPAGRT